jgi:hypothetical protein
MAQVIYAYGTVTITVAAAEKIAVYTEGSANVFLQVGYPNAPTTWSQLATVTGGQTVYGAYASGAVIRIDNIGAAPVSYATGTAPVVQVNATVKNAQGAPTAMTTAATMTSASILSRIVTGTHTAGATAAYTLPTGALFDASTDLAVDESVDWVLINLSLAAADTITVTAGDGHTIVGNPIVQSAHVSTGGVYGNSSQWRTRKTAANTMVSYRIA